jgi:hypothetical protein
MEIFRPDNEATYFLKQGVLMTISESDNQICICIDKKRHESIANKYDYLNNVKKYKLAVSQLHGHFETLEKFLIDFNFIYYNIPKIISPQLAPEPHQYNDEVQIWEKIVPTTLEEKPQEPKPKEIKKTVPIPIMPSIF